MRNRWSIRDPHDLVRPNENRRTRAKQRRPNSMPTVTGGRPGGLLLQNVAARVLRRCIFGKQGRGTFWNMHWRIYDVRRINSRVDGAATC